VADFRVLGEILEIETLVEMKIKRYLD